MLPNLSKTGNPDIIISGFPKGEIKIMAVPNYCKPGSMSTCTAGEKWDEHNRCYFAEKSTELNRCMFFMFDEYCDCLKAQQAEYNPVTSSIPRLEFKHIEKVDRYFDRNQEGIIARPKPIDVTNKKIRKVCPIDYTTICSKSFCAQWNWCKEPFKNK
jgi:hypothetical protein